MSQLIRVFLVMVIVTLGIASAGGDGKLGMSHAHGYMDPATHLEILTLDANQQALLVLWQVAQYDLENLLTNLKANSLDANGDFDRALFMTQLEQNQAMVDAYRQTHADFMHSLSDEQLQQLQAGRPGCRKQHKTQ